MFCEFCGAPIPDGSAQCPACGGAVRVSPTTGEAVPVQPIEAVPVQPVEPVYQAPVYQQPAYQAAPVYDQPASSRAGLGKAIAALACGVNAVIICWIPIWGWILATPLGIAGLILGIMALKSPKWKGMGIGGLVTSIIALAVNVIYLIIVLAAIGAGSSSGFSRSLSSYSRSLSRSRSRASSISRSLSRKKNGLVSIEKDLTIGGYNVSF